MGGHSGARLVFGLLIASAPAASSTLLEGPASAMSVTGGVSHPMRLAEARPVLAALGDNAPAGLRDLTGADAELRWSAWVKQHDATIRRRIAAGDEDSSST